MTETISAILSDLDFTAGFEPREIDALAGIAAPVEWDANTLIFREGDQQDVVYLIVAGRIALDILVPQQERVRISTLGPGEILGWSSVFYQKPKTARATALSPTRALVVDAAALRRLAEEDPRFGLRLARKLLEVVSDRLKATRMQLIDMFAQPRRAGPPQ